MEETGKAILSNGPYAPSELYLQSTGTKCALFKTLYGEPGAPREELEYEYLGFQHRDNNVFQHLFTPHSCHDREGTVPLGPLACLKLEDMRAWEYYDLLAEPHLVAPTEGPPTFGIYHWCEVSLDPLDVSDLPEDGREQARWSEEEIFNRLLDFIVSRAPLNDFPTIFTQKTKEHPLQFRLDGIFVFDGEHAEEGIFQIVPPDAPSSVLQGSNPSSAKPAVEREPTPDISSEHQQQQLQVETQQQQRLAPPPTGLNREPSPGRERLRRSLMSSMERIEIPQYSTLPPPSLSLDRCQGTTPAGLPCGKPTTVGSACDEHLPPGVFSPGPDGKEQYNNLAPLPSGWIPTRPPPNPPEGSETPRLQRPTPTPIPPNTPQAFPKPSISSVLSESSGTVSSSVDSQTPQPTQQTSKAHRLQRVPSVDTALSSADTPVTPSPGGGTDKLLVLPQPRISVAASTSQAESSPTDAVFPTTAASASTGETDMGSSPSMCSLDDLFSSESFSRLSSRGGSLTYHESARLVRAFRPTWIFDLDDTIVYTREGGFLNEKEILAMNLGGIEYHYIVFQVGEHTLQMTTFLRPGWLECLLQLRKRGRIYVCTMGIQAYCDAVVGLLNKLAAERLNRDLPGTAILIPLGRSAQNCGVKFLEIFSTDDVPENYRLVTEFDRQNCLIFDDRRDVWLRQHHRDDRLHVIVMKNWNPESTTVPLLDDFLADAVRIALSVVKETYRRLYQIHQRGLHPATDYIADVLLDYYTSEEKMHQVRRHLDRLGQREQERLRQFLPT